MNTEQMREQIDANRLGQMAKERPHECFLKGLGVLKLIGAIRQLEHEVREAALAASPAPMIPVCGDPDCNSCDLIPVKAVAAPQEAAQPAPRKTYEQQLAALPPLPVTHYNGYADGSEPLYTAEQMHDYALAAVEAAQPAMQEDVRHETWKQINELEVIADWIACHSNTQWAEECGYPRIMIQYAEELHEIGLTLLSRVDPERASQLRAMQKGKTYYQIPQLDKEAAQPAPVPVVQTFGNGDTKKVIDYLVKWHRDHFKGPHYTKYIQKRLAKDFAFELANYLVRSAAPAQQEQAPQPMTDELPIFAYEETTKRGNTQLIYAAWFEKYGRPFKPTCTYESLVRVADVEAVLSRHPALPVSAPVASERTDEEIDAYIQKLLNAGAAPRDKRETSLLEDCGFVWMEQKYGGMQDHWECGYYAPAMLIAIAKYMAAPVAIDDLKEQNAELVKDAGRYRYVIDCECRAAKAFLPGLDECVYKTKLRAKHDAAMKGEAN